MKISIFKIIKYERYLFAIFMTFLMFLFAALFDNKEIIFPEILAIMTGAWVLKRLPWNVNKRRIFVLMTFSAFAGVMIVKYLPVSMFFQVQICFFLTGLALIFAKSDFVPIISTGILPVYFQIQSFDYAIAVTIMTVIIVFFQWLLEKYGFNSSNTFSNDNFDLKQSFKKLLLLLLIFSVISVVPLKTQNIFFLVPPLIVTFVSFSNINNRIRQKPIEIVTILTSAAILGTVIRILLNIANGVPLSICAIISVSLLFIIFDYSRTYFPPAGAILLLPMIINSSALKFFPIEVFIGSSVLITVALLVFNKRNNN